MVVRRLRMHMKKRTAPRPTVQQPWVDLPLFVRKLKFHIIDGIPDVLPEVNLIDPETGLVCYTTPSLPSEQHARTRATFWAWRHGFRKVANNIDADFYSFKSFMKGEFDDC